MPRRASPSGSTGARRPREARASIVGASSQRVNAQQTASSGVATLRASPVNFCFRPLRQVAGATSVSWRTLLSPITRQTGTRRQGKACTSRVDVPPADRRPRRALRQVARLSRPARVPGPTRLAACGASMGTLRGMWWARSCSTGGAAGAPRASWRARAGCGQSAFRPNRWFER